MRAVIFHDRWGASDVGTRPAKGKHRRAACSSRCRLFLDHVLPGSDCCDALGSDLTLTRCVKGTCLRNRPARAEATCLACSSPRRRVGSCPGCGPATAQGRGPGSARSGHWSFGGPALPTPGTVPEWRREERQQLPVMEPLRAVWHFTPNNLEVAVASPFYRWCSCGSERTVLWATHWPASAPDCSWVGREHTR